MPPEDDPTPAAVGPTPNMGPENHVTSSGAFPNRREYTLRVETWLNWQSGTRVSVHVEAHVDGDGSSFSGYDKSSWESWSQGGMNASWHGAYDFRNGTTRRIHYGDFETNVHNDGHVDVDFYANFDIMGYVELHPDIWGTAPTAPGAPIMYQPTNITTTSMTSTFSGTTDGGVAISGWTLQRATDANFTQNVYTVASNGTDQHTGLTPGTTYYFRSYGSNAIGNSAWSNTTSAGTLPAVPPGLTVASSPSGTSATITLSPPGGVGGVTKYVWQWRVKGTTTPISEHFSSVVVNTETGLTPGETYEWRASAFYGTYQSPWTDSIAVPAGTWLALTQAKPNTNPGDYFDGSTPDPTGGDLNYQWGTDGLGTPDASISTAVASGVAGWEAEFANGTGVLYRITAGIVSSTYAARVQVLTDTTAAGALRAGQLDAAGYWSDVTIGGTYVGSIYVRPSRAQRLAAEITWLTTAGAVVSRTVGAATEVPGGSWLRLVAGGSTPANAVHAVVRVIDVSGTGWSTWKGGDTLELDGAMISLSEEFPYFDGSTLPTDAYLYEWVDADSPHASTSKRTNRAQASPAALSVLGANPRVIIDPGCKPPAPPRPPTIPSDCITEAGIWRRLFAPLPATFISDWLDVVPTFEIETLSYEVAQARIRIYRNPTNGPANLVDTTSWISEQIISYVPKNTVLTIDGVHQRVWAEVAGGEAQSADHLLYGSNGTPATWPILSCGVGYAITVDLPVEILQGDTQFHTYLTTRY